LGLTTALSALAFVSAVGVTVARADHERRTDDFQSGREWRSPTASEQEAATNWHSGEARAIRGAVQEQVKNHWYDISITSNPDEVSLRGQVDSEEAHREVIKAAQSVSKRQVKDNLSIRPRPSDQEVSESIARTLKKEYPKLARDLTVDVDDGIARLEGNLANHRQVDQVLASVLMLEGVRDVDSAVTVKGKPYPLEVAEARSMKSGMKR
jgi:osmotically-inducible protein OsmY